MKKVFHSETFERIPAERRQKIIDTAVREFARKGFNNANINVIAAEAGVSVGSIYKYFRTKEDLFLTCVNDGLETLETVLGEVMESHDKLLVKVEKIIRLIQSHSRSRKDLIIFYNEITSESNSQVTWKLASKMEALSARVYTALIRQAQEDGAARKEISPELFAFFLDNLFMMLQFSYACEYYRRRFKIYAGEDIFEKDELVVEQLLGMIKAALETGRDM